jgi:sterol desaturase/sphingolipid hydroxylase (fatty acid hydroxylase superfamily)
MPADTGWLQYIYRQLWVYFVDHHLLATPALGGLAVAVALIAGEVLFRDWNKTTLYRLLVRRSMTAKIDFAYFILRYVGLVTLLEVVLTFGLAVAGARFGNYVSDQLQWARITLPSDGVLQIAFSFVVYWIVSGFTGYWLHRIYHWPVFWNVHRFHHAAPELNFLTAHRAHPLEMMTQVLSFLSPMIFLQVPDSIVLFAVFAGSFINFCQHSELPWDWGWIGRWIFGSPMVHQIHHSTDEEHRDRNFCNCPLWDHVFGTWYDGAKRPVEYGVGDPGYDLNPVRQFVRDSWNFYRDLAAWLSIPIRKATALWERAPSNGENPSAPVP